MSNYFNIYFNIESNQEIIKYRKIKKEYLLEVQEPEDLIEYGIDESENPYHIIDFKSITEETPAYEAVFIDCISGTNKYEIKVQPIGTCLIDFLNINLKDENDLKRFAFKYGLDNLLWLDKSHILNNCIIYTVSDFDKNFTRFFNSIKNVLSKIQQEFKETITFCFNDSGDNKINKLNPKQRYFLSFHGCDGNIYFTKMPKLQKYSKGISINYDSFFTTDIDLNEFFTEQLINTVSAKDFTFAPSFYSCLRIENALFISFINLLETKEFHINICANCGKFFIPISKSNEIYCDNPLADDPSRTCKVVGADKKYKAKIKDNEIIALIRSTSSTLSMRVKRNPDIIEHEIKYNKWKVNYPIQMKKYQDRKITKDELINWINDVRR